MTAAMTATGKALQVRKPTLPVARPTIALALGGGGARGLAHLLMLEVLDELGLKPKIIAGTSIGAVFGAAYASGLSAKRIRAHVEEALSQRFGIARQLLSARSEPVLKILNILPIRSSLLKPESLLEFMLPSAMPRDFARPRDPAQGRCHRLLCPGADGPDPGLAADRGCRQHCAAGALHAGHAQWPHAHGRRARQSAPLRRPQRRCRHHGCYRRERRARRARQAAAPLGLFGADGLLADHAANDRAREAQGAAAGHLYRCRGGRLLRAGLPPLQADPGRRGARQGTAAPPARARPRQPGG